MVVETVFPGSSDEHSTVSTRLFLPATKLRSSLSEDTISGSASKNILAMTFRQVVLQQLWSFELVVFGPGSERDMDDLENHPREVSASSFKLSSSDERVISALAEAVCVSALQSTERNFLDKYIGRSLYNIFRWLQKPGKFLSKDSSAVVTKLFDDKIVENARSLLDDFNSAKAHFKPARNELKYRGCEDLLQNTTKSVQRIMSRQASSAVILIQVGLVEPGLKIPYPDQGVVAIELLMSTKPDSLFRSGQAKFRYTGELIMAELCDDIPFPP